MMKQILSFMIAIVLIASVCPVSFSAAGEIEISNASELRRIGVDPALPLGGNYKLTADIDLSGTQWFPIGNSDGSETLPFTGSFDGQGHVISGLVSGGKRPFAQEDDGWGLFASLNNATVKNLILKDVSFYVYAQYDLADGVPEGYNGVGAIAGYANGSTKIENISVVDATLIDIGSRQTRIGGIVGSVNGSAVSVRNCLFSGSVRGAFGYQKTIDYMNYQCSAAGIVGNATSACNIENCLVVGDVSVADGYGYAHPVASCCTQPEVAANLRNCYYFKEPDLGFCGTRSVDRGGCLSLYTEELYNGTFDKLGADWTVKENQIPYPTAAPVALNAMTFTDGKTALEDALKDFYPSNYTTAEDLVRYAQSVLHGVFEVKIGGEITVTKSTDQDGLLRGSLILSSGGETAAISVDRVIEALPEMTYEFSSQVKGLAHGTITLRFAVKNERTYTLRWGTAEGPIAGYTPVDVFKNQGKTVHSVFRRNDLIPMGVTHLWLCDGDTLVLPLALPSERLLPAGDAKYVFGVVSDMHLDNDTNTKAVDTVLKQFAADKVDFVASLGDNTTNNKVEQLGNWKQLKLKYPSLSVYSTLGNHDILPRHTAGGIGKYDESKYSSFVTASLNRFKQYFENTEDYDYTLEQGDDLIIFLGLGKADEITESAAKGGQALGKAQLDWLDETLDQYYNKDKKTGHVFLMFHYYTRGTIDTVTTASALQEGSSKKLEAVLAKYKDRGLIYFSGHNHYSFDVGMNIFDSRPGYTMVHCPSASRSTSLNDAGHNMGREGFYVEVYDNFVLVKGYNFLRKEVQTNALYMLSVKDSMTLTDAAESVTVGGAEGTTPPVSDHPAGETNVSGNNAPQNEQNSSVVLWILVGGLVILAAGGALLVILMKKKK